MGHAYGYWIAGRLCLRYYAHCKTNIITFFARKLFMCTQHLSRHSTCWSPDTRRKLYSSLFTDKWRAFLGRKYARICGCAAAIDLVFRRDDFYVSCSIPFLKLQPSACDAVVLCAQADMRRLEPFREVLQISGKGTEVVFGTKKSRPPHQEAKVGTFWVFFCSWMRVWTVLLSQQVLRSTKTHHMCHRHVRLPRFFA